MWPRADGRDFFGEFLEIWAEKFIGQKKVPTGEFPVGGARAARKTRPYAANLSRNQFPTPTLPPNTEGYSQRAGERKTKRGFF